MRAASPLVVILCLAQAITNASAQRAGTMEVSMLGVWHTKTTTMDALRAVGVGARVGVWLPLNFELEGQFDVTSPRQWLTGRPIRMYHAAGSLLYNVPIGGGSVYLRGGMGKLRATSNCEIRLVPCITHSALTGAAGFRVPLGTTLLFRAEGMIRNRASYHYTSFGASAGLTLMSSSRQGEKGSSGPDADGDGVSNRRDRCPDTPRGALTDARGCPSDFDGDGVADGIDRCPATPKGEPVDPVGCSVKRPD